MAGDLELIENALIARDDAQLHFGRGVKHRLEWSSLQNVVNDIAFTTALAECKRLVATMDVETKLRYMQCTSTYQLR